MIPLSIIRTEPERIAAGIKAKGESLDLKAVSTLDEQVRKITTEMNELRAQQNRASEEIAVLKRAGKSAQSEIEAMRKVSERLKKSDEEIQSVKADLDELLARIPNLPHESVPPGDDPRQNVVVREWGNKPDQLENYQSHLSLGKELSLLDLERAAKISGSGFPLYTNLGAKLERSLINFMLDLHTEDQKFVEVFPPFLTKTSSGFTCGQLPKFADDMYTTENEELWLIPTAEVPVTNIHRDEILDEDQLPLYYAAYSACFRREAGSYGKETRGLLRVHQFNKVELVKFVSPADSYDELESLTVQAESVLQALGLHYRVIELCTGDLSFAAAKCYDLEVWAPGEQQWLEVSSCSNFGSFQARRGNIRYRRKNDKKVDFVHTLNGSGVATPRLMVALLETFQTEDGKINLPGPLQPYMGMEILG